MFKTNEQEVHDLMERGLARDPQHAIEILEEIEAENRHADLLILYTDSARVRGHLTCGLVGERQYRFTSVRVAAIPSGAISQLANAPQRTLVAGSLKEFVTRLDQDAKLVAFVRNYPFRGRSGIFFSPFPAKKVCAAGKKTIDQREDLFRVEFEPIHGDYVLGMFSAWGQLRESDDISLVLHIPRVKTLFL